MEVEGLPMKSEAGGCSIGAVRRDDTVGKDEVIGVDSREIVGT